MPSCSSFELKNLRHKTTDKITDNVLQGFQYSQSSYCTKNIYWILMPCKALYWSSERRYKISRQYDFWLRIFYKLKFSFHYNKLKL